MKTLRELANIGERKSGYWGTRAYEERLAAKLDAVLDPYGDYRVVEGVLEQMGARVGVKYGRQVEGHDCVMIDPIGRIGDHVKLILPPEEKKEAGAELNAKAMYEAYKLAAGQRDRYEQALMDIADVRTEPLGVAREMKRKAKEALDDC